MPRLEPVDERNACTLSGSVLYSWRRARPRRKTMSRTSLPSSSATSGSSFMPRWFAESHKAVIVVCEQSILELVSSLRAIGVEPYARPPTLRPPDEPPAPGAAGPASEPGSSASSAPDVGRSPVRQWVDDWARFRGATEAYLNQLREQLNWAQHQAELRALNERLQAAERGRAQAQREAAAAAAAAAAALAAPAPKCWCWPWR
eukprot:XP_001703569.1 predicted protein [Chlamydomonas reinhardtii]